MTEKFTWRVNATASGGPEFTVAQIQFGDQYSQQLVVDINPEINTWSVTVSGHRDKIIEVINFLRANRALAFFWAPPLGVEGTYRLRGPYKIQNQGGTHYTIDMEFEQCYIFPTPAEIAPEPGLYGLLHIVPLVGGSSYVYQLWSYGAVGAVNFSLISGTLPSGCTLYFVGENPLERAWYIGPEIGNSGWHEPGVYTLVVSASDGVSSDTMNLRFEVS